MRSFLRVFIFLFLSTSAAAQSGWKLDSLQKRLSGLPQDTDRVNTLNRLAEFSKDSTEITTYTNEAITLARKLDYKKGEAGSHIVLGYFYARKQIDFVKAVNNYTEALKLREEIGDDKGAAQCYMQLAIIDGKFENYSKALGLLHKSEVLYKKINYISGLKSDYQAEAQMYMNSNKFDSALYYFRYASTLGKETTVSTAIRDINLVSIFVSTHQIDSALRYIHLTDSIYDVLGNSYGKLWDKMQMGQVELDRGNNNEAVRLLRMVYDTAEKTQNGDLLFNVLPPLINAYRKVNNAVDGFRLQTEYMTLRDSLKNSDKANTILGEQIRYEQEIQDKVAALQHEQEKALNDAEQHRKNIILWFVGIGFFAVLVFAVFIFRSYREKKKVNMIIQKQKEEVELQKDVIEEKQKEIIDSIRYAKRIQQSLLPTEKAIHKNLSKKE